KARANACLDRPERNAGALRDLRVRNAAEEAELDGFALFDRELRQSVADSRRVDVGKHLLFEQVAVRHGFAEISFRIRLAAQNVERLIARDARDPACKVAALEPIGRAPDFKEDSLRDVLSRAGVAEN